MKKKMPLIGILLMLVTVGLVLYYGTISDEPRELFYSGVLESEQVDIAFEVAGRVKELRVREGQRVEVGETLVVLEPAQTKSSLEAAGARLRQAQANLDQLNTGYRSEDIRAAQARVEEAAAELSRFQNGPTSEQLRESYHQRESAQERVSWLQRGTRPEEVQKAVQRSRQAQSQMEKAERDYTRFRVLRKEGAAPASVLEEKRLNFQLAQAELSSRNEELKMLREGYRSEEKAMARADFGAASARYQDLLQGTRPELIAAARARLLRAEEEALKLSRGPREEEVRAAREEVAARRAELERWEILLDKTVVKSPVSGVVSSLAIEVGETVNPGVPIVQLTNPEDIWVNVFIPEPDLPKVKLGDDCRVFLDGVDSGGLQGKLRYIAPTSEFTPRFVQTERERVRLVYRAEVQIFEGFEQVKNGLPADVQVARP